MNPYSQLSSFNIKGYCLGIYNLHERKIVIGLVILNFLSYICQLSYKRKFMISSNEYFDGNVKSLGYTSATGKSTLG